MIPTECVHEDRVVAAMLSGAWPNRCDQELVAHSATCAHCREVEAVVMAIRDDSERARSEVQVPVAGQVWWRAAVRARLESTQTATRPITWLHGITAAFAIGLALAVIGMFLPSLAVAFESAKAVIIAMGANGDVLGVMLGALRQSILFALFAGACLVAAPLAIYLALVND